MIVSILCCDWSSWKVLISKLINLGLLDSYLLDGCKIHWLTIAHTEDTTFFFSYLHLWDIDEALLSSLLTNFHTRLTKELNTKNLRLIHKWRVGFKIYEI